MEIFYEETLGEWIYSSPIPKNCNKYYSESFIRYYNIFYIIFDNAFKKSEFSSLLALFHVRGIENPGWNTYESTVRNISSIKESNVRIIDPVAQCNLHLWLYGHIVEASEPYELIANLLDICDGMSYITMKFPNDKKGNPEKVSNKIKTIIEKAQKLNFEYVSIPYKEIWDRELRNSIFHSDYTIFNDEVRTINPTKSFSKEDILRYVNRSLAYFDSINNLKNYFISRYKEPKIIEMHPDQATISGEKAQVIVRKGYGAVGIKDNWTSEELLQGYIPHRIGRFYPDEVKLLQDNPLLAFLPERAT